jgi:ACS family hexuronate transporter-like MFS transporter
MSQKRSPRALREEAFPVSRPDDSASHLTAQPEGALRASAWAWGLCWLMFASTVLNYMDRQAISLVGAQIRESFAITQYEDFGWVLSAFMMTYALFQVPAGYLVDRWDLRWSYAAAVAWWSMAALATALVPSLGMLLLCRALLGVGESFNWPCALKVTSRVLPPLDRSLGNGIFNSGAAVGAVVTPLVVNVLTPRFGWRVTFAIIGSAGFIWVAMWLVLVQGEQRQLLGKPQSKAVVREPLDSPRARLSPTAQIGYGAVLTIALAVALSTFKYGPSALWLGIAVAMIGPLIVAAALPRDHFQGGSLGASLGAIVRLRRFWIMVVVSVSINICWHFLINWVPTYLKDERGLSDQTGNYLSAVTFLAADAGNLGGGWLSRLLASRGLSVVRARQTVMGLCALMMLSGLGIGLPQTDASAMVLLTVMAAGTAAFMANYFAFTQEVTSLHTGLVVGYLGGLGNLFVARFQPIFGGIKDLTGSFALNFLVVGIAPLVGMAVLLWGWIDGGERTPKDGAAA